MHQFLLEIAFQKILNRLYPDFYGTATIQFQAGKVHSLKIEESFKIEAVAPPSA